MGTLCAGISRLLFSGSFPWRFAMPLLRARAVAAKFQPLSQNGEIVGLSKVQIIDQDPGSVLLFYRDLRDVGFLIFQAAFWGRGFHADTEATLFG